MSVAITHAFLEHRRAFNLQKFPWAHYEARLPMDWTDTEVGVYSHGNYRVVHHLSGRFTAWICGDYGSKCLGRNIRRLGEAIVVCIRHEREHPFA